MIKLNTSLEGDKTYSDEINVPILCNIVSVT